MRGLLDPKQVNGPAYFGNTAHKEGDMVNFVQHDLTDTTNWEPKDIEAVIAAMAAEAGVPHGGGPSADAEVIRKGRELIADGERCGSCHRFSPNETEPGDAPDLVGWGSREWIVGIIIDPTHERFYGTTNDRMPSFGKSAEGGAPMLSQRQIEVIADWLRGDWYRPAAHAH